MGTSTRETLVNRSDYTIIAMYEKGYRVSEDGVATDPGGHPLTYNSQPVHTPDLEDNLLNVQVSLRRFAAYCFFGDKLFGRNIRVFSWNGDIFDFSKVNLHLSSDRRDVRVRKR